MSQMVNFKGDLIRICPDNPHRIEYARNNATIWVPRYTGTFYGEFLDLTATPTELIAITSKGTYISRNGGVAWIKRG